MKQNYLETHLEPPSSDDRVGETKEEMFKKYPESVRRLLKPDIKYKKNGKERVELKDGWMLEYTYKELNEQEVESFSNEYTGSLVQDIKAGKFRRLTNLTIKGPKKKGLDLMNDFQINDILFSTDGDAYQAGISKGKIFSYSPPNSFFGIMAILHEVGHLVTRQKILSNPDQMASLKTAAKKLVANKIFNTPLVHSFLPKKLNEFAGETVLKEERAAWSVAVSALRKTLSAFDISQGDFLDAIHKAALTTYSERIRQL